MRFANFPAASARNVPCSLRGSSKNTGPLRMLAVPVSLASTMWKEHYEYLLFVAYMTGMLQVLALTLSCLPAQKHPVLQRGAQKQSRMLLGS